MAGSQTGVPKGIPGFHTCLFVRDKYEKIAKVLQTQPLADYPLVDAIKFNGIFPFAHLEYEDEALPVECVLEAFSPLLPGDEKNSGWPAAIFKFKITNPFSRSMEVALLSSARNLIGEGGVGRFNQVVDTPKALHINFYNKKTQTHDPASGEMALTILKNKNLECTYLGEWNMQGRHFFFDSLSLSLGEAWTSFAKEGILPNINTEKAVASESFQVGGALAAKTLLRPKTSVTITFILSWYFPVSNEGHVYETWFRNVSEVTQGAVEKSDFLYRATREWAKELAALKIEPWLKDALVNNLYPLASGSFWSKRGRFGLFEAPEICPLLGTLDVRFYGSLPLLLFFPQLELKEMSQFAEAQRPQGYIPHDLGYKRSDLPSNSTNGLFWKDLNSKFILLAYRDFLWTKDESFLRKSYPFIKKAFYWLAATDKNKDYLPDNDGADQTFDLWNFYGASAYTSSLFLASLLALQRIATLLGDAEMQKEASLWFKKGRISFEKKLWHKTYFIAYNNIKEGLSEHQISHHVKAQKISIACTVGQLAGQWSAHQLGLGYIVSEEKVKRAVSTMLERNGSSSPFGAVNAVLPSGEKDKTNAHSENIWFGMTYALAALAIYEGFEKEGLSLAKKAWENVTLNMLNPWNQPDMCSSSDGSTLFGDHGMRNMVVWGVFLALAKKNKQVEGFLSKLQSYKKL